MSYRLDFQIFKDGSYYLGLFETFEDAKVYCETNNLNLPRYRIYKSERYLTLMEEYEKQNDKDKRIMTI